MLRGELAQRPRDSDDAERQAAAGGVADAVRLAVERTMRATAGGRGVELVDEVVRRGREARGELARRGQEAGAGLARRGQEATGEMGKRLEVLERRLAELEGRLAGADQRRGSRPRSGPDRGQQPPLPGSRSAPVRGEQRTAPESPPEPVSKPKAED